MQIPVGKSEDFVRGFTEAYQKKSRVDNTNAAWFGTGYSSCCVVWCIAFIIIIDWIDENVFIYYWNNW